MNTQNQNMTHNDTCFVFTSPFPSEAQQSVLRYTAGALSYFKSGDAMKTLPAGWTLPNCKQWLAPHRDAAAYNPFICIPSISVSFHFPFWTIHTLGMQHLEGFKKLLGHTPYIRKSHLFLEIFRTSNKLYLEATVQQDMDREYGRTQIWGNTLHQMYNVKEDNAHCVHCSVFPLRVVEAWTYLTKIIKYLFEHFFAPAPTTSRKIKTF